MSIDFANIKRARLSSPIRMLRDMGFLDGRYSVFDYGCGRGDDVIAMREMGVDANGFDVKFFSDNPLFEADIVNLGFVINVIPNKKDRTLNAFKLARKFLIISVPRYESVNSRRNYTRFNDGYITTRTFQMHYVGQEVQNYILSVLKSTPYKTETGIFIVAK
ncbi:MAG: hypothetical protein BWK79_20125 [Beggiatoa sp. IS2]|nr:MAG: hypothetical protein BWK79_20125 [Beggiatoa sp. IS2]